MSSRSSDLWQSLSTDESFENLSVSQIGGKAYNMIKGCRCGHRSPDGFVLTVKFFEPWLEQLRDTDLPLTVPRSRSECEVLQSRCSSLTFTETQQHALDDAVRAVFDGGDDLSSLVAVRSSSPHEDSSRASFAGIYHSTLGVPLEPRSQLHQAILSSFASSFNYGAICVVEETVPLTHLVIAVIVQRQIDASVSGVAFSLDPISNCYDDAVISANFGLGETVVAGLVIPDTYTVDKVKRKILIKNVSAEKTTSHVLDQSTGYGVLKETPCNPSHQALSDEQILEVAALVTSVEETMAVPVDIEWVFDKNGSLHLVQARPITTFLKLFREMTTQPGETKRLYLDAIVGSQGFSDPLSVMGLQIWARMVTDVLPHYTHGDDGMVWELHGREYILLSNLLAMAGGKSMVQKAVAAMGDHPKRALDTIDLQDYAPSQVTQKNKYFVWSALKFAMGVFPSFVRGVWDWETAVAAYKKCSEEIFNRFRPDGEEDMCEDVSFQAAVDKAMAAFCELMPLHMTITATYYYKWRLRRLFAEDAEALDLLVALEMNLDGNPTSEMGHAMLKIASSPEIQAITSSSAFMDKWNKKQLSTELIDTLQEFVARFGCRGMREIDVAVPRSYEDLAGLFDRIKQIDVQDNQILTVDKRKQEALEVLSAKARVLNREEQFKHYSNVIHKMGGYREHPKYMFVFLLAYLRRRAIKLAEQLVKDGRLHSTQSVFDLSVEQLDMVLSDPGIDAHDLVRSNKAPYESVANTKDWPLLIDSRGKILRGHREDVAEGLGGDPISRGVCTGRARVLHTPYEQPLLRGEILVTRAAEPSWTPIFLNASAVVLEVGGPTQHGAIIAREYGIPCVSGVEEATKLIKDGQLIEVDGSRGIVRFVDEGKVD